MENGLLAAFEGCFSLTGYQSYFCETLILVASGGVLYEDGDEIRRINNNSQFVPALTDTEQGRYLIVEFTGCLLAALFVVSLSIQ